MVSFGGYWGKCLEIDLSNNSINISDKHMQYVQDYIGGRVLGLKLLWEALKDKPGYDPLGPDNPLMFIPGPSSGVPIIGAASRYVAVCKSGITQAKNSPYGENGATVAWAASGGQFGPTIKMAGWDIIYITGKAEAPKILVINNDKVSIEDGSKYWGMGTFEFCQSIQQDYGLDYKIACIGPAAEQGCRASAIVGEIGRAAGRSGCGAVMASKNLKGIICHGDQPVPIADKNGLADMIQKYDRISWNHSGTEARRLWGTTSGLDTASIESRKSVRNHRENWDPNADELGAIASRTQYWTRDRGCLMCHQRCMKLGIVRNGQFKGQVGEGPEYEAAMTSSNWLLTNMDDFGGIGIYKIDELGYDTIGVGGIVGFVLDCYEQGIITEDMLGGIKMEWGNATEINKFLDALTYNHDLEIYDWLRRGSTYAANKIGGNAPYYAMDCKNASFSAHGVQSVAAGGRGFAYGTSERGSCHRTGLNAAAHIANFAVDFGVFCSFSSGCYGTAGMVEIINFIMGTNYTQEQFLYIAEKGIHLAKVFNCQEGFRREDDALPERVHTEPIQWGPKAGTCFPLEEYNANLDAFYNELGLDPVTTIPTVARLEELGLTDLIPYVEKLK